MGVIAALTGQSVPFTHEGVTYQVSPWTFEVQGAFERYLEAETINGFYRTSHLHSQKHGEAALAALYLAIGAGEFTFGGPRVAAALSSPKHLRYMFYLCLKKNHPELDSTDIEVWGRDSRVFDRMVEAMNQANFDPNQPAPEKT